MTINDFIGIAEIVEQSGGLEKVGQDIEEMICGLGEGEGVEFVTNDYIDRIDNGESFRLNQGGKFDRDGAIQYMKERFRHCVFAAKI